MCSGKSSVQGWKTGGTVVAVLMILRALGPAAGWAQEPDQSRIEEETSKQKKIYQSRGADVPDGYVTNRGLSDYAGLLPSGFCDALGRLGTSDRWLDIGAGAGQAILDYYAPPEPAAPAEKCARPGGLASAVAISIEDRRTDAWHQLAASLGERIRYLTGKSLRHYSLEELGKFQIITDVYGGFSYTEDLSRFMEKMLSVLEVGGGFYTIVQYVHLQAAKDSPTTGYQTELVDAAGRHEKVCSWLKKTACVQVTCESKSTWETPTEQINIRKVCSDVSVPRMKLVKFEAGNPPNRRFQLEP
jgi:SAM-dependent methyltransferase